MLRLSPRQWRRPLLPQPCDAGWTCRAMSRTNPASSRAIAVTTFGSGLPAALRWRWRRHSRTCAFQPIGEPLPLDRFDDRDGPSGVVNAERDPMIVAEIKLGQIA